MGRCISLVIVRLVPGDKIPAYHASKPSESLSVTCTGNTCVFLGYCMYFCPFSSALRRVALSNFSQPSKDQNPSVVGLGYDPTEMMSEAQSLARGKVPDAGNSPYE